jgi:hypothetical protein
MSATIPITPTDTPSPIPIFAPVDIPSSVGEGFAVEDVGDRAFVEEIGDANDSDEELVMLPEELDVGVEVAGATLKPTTAIAPTLDSRATVVSTILQSVDAPAAVDA